MTDPETRLFCLLDGLTPFAREKQRLNTLTDLGLLEAEVVPVFEEAAQTATRFLQVPICIIGIMTQDEQWLKSTVGLSRLGLMNKLATSRCLPRLESFCTYVVDSHQPLAITDTVTNPVFATSSLVQHYGIRSYLGVPLLTTSGQCLGTLAVMDLVPRTFTTKEIEFLAITARWSLSEFERNYLLKEQYKASNGVSKLSPIRQDEETTGKVEDIVYEETISTKSAGLSAPLSTNSIKMKLLNHLAQELRTPLTSVMGMASVLSHQVYGSLTNKQKEYLEIIHHSGQHLVSLVDEILALELWDEGNLKLTVMSVDIEMLCQQAINGLLQVAKQRDQQIRLSVEPGNRIWSLDKDKVRQMLYYLLFSLIYSAEAGSVIRTHVSRKSERLNISVWVSHPWLGDSLPQIHLDMRDRESLISAAAISNGLEAGLGTAPIESQERLSVLSLPSEDPVPLGSSVLPVPETAKVMNNRVSDNGSRESLGLLFSCYLADINGGKILIQGSSQSGYRYVVSLPQLTVDDMQ